MFPSAAHPRSLPHRGQDEQGLGRGPRRRIAQDGTGRSPATAFEVTVVRTQTQRESHFSAEVPPARFAPVQPANGPCLSAQERLSAVLELQLSALGRLVS